MPFEKHVLRQDLNIGTESVTECAEEIPASRRGSTLTSDPHYRERIPGGVKPPRSTQDKGTGGLHQQSRAWCVSLPQPDTTQSSDGARWHIDMFFIFYIWFLFELMGICRKCSAGSVMPSI